MSWFTIIKDEPLARSFALLQNILKENSNKIAIIEEPELDGNIYGIVEVTGTSGEVYTVDFSLKCPTINKHMAIDSAYLTDYLMDWWEIDDEPFNKEVEICIEGEGSLPEGDKLTSMVLGLLNDEDTAEKIESLDNAINSDPIDYGYIVMRIKDAIDNIINEYKEEFVGRFEQ